MLATRRLGALLGLAAAALGAGCVFRTYETNKVATFGYQRPRVVALITAASEPGLGASMRGLLVGSGRVEIQTDRIADTLVATDPEGMCRALTGAPEPPEPVRVEPGVVIPEAAAPALPDAVRFPPPPTPPSAPSASGPPGAGMVPGPPVPPAPPLPPPPPPAPIASPLAASPSPGQVVAAPPPPSPWLLEAPVLRPGEPVAPPYPAELIVVALSTVGLQHHHHCPFLNRRTEWGSIFEDDDGGGPGYTCTEEKYDSTNGAASARLVALSPATCAIVQDVDVKVTADSARGELEVDERVVKSSLDAQLRNGKLAALVERFLPPGIEVATARGAAIELSGPDAAALVPGTTYALLGDRADGRTQLGRMRIDRRDATTASAVIDRPPLALTLGDELAAFSYAHEWKLVPMLTVGELVGDARRSPLVGAGLGLRWTYPRAYLQAEALFSHQLVPDFDGTRNDLGLAFGGRLPLGPIVPFAMGEAGLAFLPKEQVGTMKYFHTKTFVGVAAGVELWFGRYVVLLDARLRRATGLAADSALDESYRERTVQLGFGQRL